MHKFLFLMSAAFLALAWWASDALIEEPPSQAAAARPSVVEPARAFLATLDEPQRRKATFAFDDAERFNWHFIPRERKGIPLKEMNAGQRKAFRALLEASLSRIGVDTVEKVRELEAILAEMEGPNRRFPRDPELYFASFFGEPQPGKRWGWRFEGHHLSLNFTLEGDTVLSATPLFLGANPAIVPHGPKKGLRVLAGVEDIARELFSSLEGEARAKALGKGRPEEIRGTGSAKYPGPLPQGLASSELDEKQMRLLKKLVRDYIKHLKPADRRAILKEIREAGWDKVTLVWRGSLKPFEGHSYLVYGPTFIIGYANFQNGARHIHSVFRDTTGEFGLVEGGK